MIFYVPDLVMLLTVVEQPRGQVAPECFHVLLIGGIRRRRCRSPLPQAQNDSPERMAKTPPGERRGFGASVLALLPLN